MIHDPNARTFALSKLDFAGCAFLMESFINPWGRDDPIVDDVLAGKFDEVETLSRWTFTASFAPPYSLVLDIGAYTGLFSLIAVETHPTIRSVAFEPATITFGRLARNIQWNRMDTRVIPVNLAASDISGTSILPHRWGIYTMSPGEGFEQTEIDHTEAVTTLQLDSLLEPCERLPHFLNSRSVPAAPISIIAAIKIDVEGHEGAVLRGGIELIRKHRPVLICESLSVEAERANSDILTAESYVTTRIENERNLMAIPKEHEAQWNANYASWKEIKAPSLCAKSVLTFSF
jgi:FkbM family methyltransferase